MEALLWLRWWLLTSQSSNVASQRAAHPLKKPHQSRATVPVAFLRPTPGTSFYQLRGIKVSHRDDGSTLEALLWLRWWLLTSQSSNVASQRAAHPLKKPHQSRATVPVAFLRPTPGASFHQLRGIKVSHRDDGSTLEALLWLRWWLLTSQSSNVASQRAAHPLKKPHQSRATVPVAFFRPTPGTSFYQLRGIKVSHRDDGSTLEALLWLRWWLLTSQSSNVASQRAAHPLKKPHQSRATVPVAFLRPTPGTSFYQLRGINLAIGTMALL